MERLIYPRFASDSFIIFVTHRDPSLFWPKMAASVGNLSCIITDRADYNRPVNVGVSNESLPVPKSVERFQLLAGADSVKMQLILLGQGLVFAVDTRGQEAACANHARTVQVGPELVLQASGIDAQQLGGGITPAGVDRGEHPHRPIRTGLGELQQGTGNPQPRVAHV